MDFPLLATYHEAMQGSDALAVTASAEECAFDIPRKQLIELVLNSVSSPHTKQAYRRALADFLAWCQAQPGLKFTKATVQKYRSKLEESGLASSSINIRLSAIRKLATEAADNGILSPVLANGIARIRGVKHFGTRLGNWLAGYQAEHLLQIPDVATAKGKRDRALLGILLGSGLRRAEAVSLTIEHIQLREGRWVIADLVGKHHRVRTVPIPEWVKSAIDEWTMSAGIEAGKVFRPINKAGWLAGDSLSAQSVFKLVREYTQLLGFKLAPHDLRRSHAKLAYRGGAQLEQIRFSLGHASIRTTEAYLGLQQDLIDAPCDHLAIFTAHEQVISDPTASQPAPAD